MAIESLGHVVVNVRDLGRAEQFYNGVLGLPIVARLDELGGMTFFSLGNHHDFAIHAVGPDAPDADWMGSLGLFHVAFKVGESLDELRTWKERLEANGVKVELQADHTVTCSLYVRDPDGNGVELYVDTSDIWKKDPQSVATMQPLNL